MSGAVVDTLAVCGLCLRDILQPIIAQEAKRTEASNGSNGLLFGNDVDPTSGFTTILAREAGVAQRRLYGVMHCEHATVGLRVADNLLCALDRPDLLQVLDVFERPRNKRLGFAGTHVGCQFAAARRLASVEPAVTGGAPDCGGVLLPEQEAA